MATDDDFYQDEPIGCPPDGGATGSRATRWDYVASPPSRQPSGAAGRLVDAADEAPADIRQLLQMIRQNYWSITNAKSFYEQALFMAGYVDCVPVVAFNAFFPTYRMMSVEQLRSYFTVRHQLRLGKHPDVPVSYLFVYAYETLMQIGVDTVEDGYDQLCDLRDNYPALNTPKQPYIDSWLRDYVVWYGLSSRYAEVFAKERHDDEAVSVLNRCAEATDGTLFGVVDEYVRHRVSKGVLYRQEPVATTSAVAFVVRCLAPLLEQRNGQPLGDLCFGARKLLPHPMFGNAVFYAPDPVREAYVEVSPLRAYLCDGGMWQMTVGVKPASKEVTPARFGELLHRVEARMRQLLGVRPPLRQKPPATPLEAVALEAVDEWFTDWRAREAEREEAARRHAVEQARANVSIDFGQLGRIRSDAAAVRDALIVDEEGASPAPPRPQAAPPPSEPPAGEKPGPASPGDPAAVFLRLVLSGGDYRAYLHGIHTPLGVMVERVNSLAMDALGDIVLEDDGGRVSLIEDYRADVEEMIKSTEPF